MILKLADWFIMYICRRVKYRLQTEFVNIFRNNFASLLCRNHISSKIEYFNTDLMRILKEMWNITKHERQKMKDQLFFELMSECSSLAPKARLSHRLRSRLERLPKLERMEIVRRKLSGRFPLLATCPSDNPEVVEFLISECGADVDQKGLFAVPSDKSVHYVTPLWCAAVEGRLSVVKCLVEHGADINAVSDTGSTPVRSACFMTQFDVVEYLVKQNADIARPNYNGGTCLINSVQSSELCEFLLKSGADPNALDIQQKTALHYAIQEHRLDTAKLLLSYGSDPFLKSKFNDDALQTAAIKGAQDVLEHLVASYQFSKQRIAEAYELLGSTCLEDSFDVNAAVRHWKKAIEIRETHNLPKVPIATGVHYGYVVEFQTLDELEAVVLDGNDMRMQSLLICERILGNSHKETLYRIMQRGAAFADSMQYERCLRLWLYIFQLRIQSDILIYKETCFAAQALVRLFCDMLELHRHGDFAIKLSFDDIYYVFNLMCLQLPEANRLISIHPQHRKQQNNYDISLGLIIQLLYILLQIKATPEQNVLLSWHFSRLVQLDPRTQIDNLSLLHLAVTQSRVLRESFGLYEGEFIQFPSFDLVKSLVEHGADVDAFSTKKLTPLYVATNQRCYRPEIVKYLLDNGAHIDRNCSKHGESAYCTLLHRSPIRYMWLNYRSLACLCAEQIKKRNIKYVGEIPKTLESFVDMH